MKECIKECKVKVQKSWSKSMQLYYGELFTSEFVFTFAVPFSLF